MRRVVLNNVAPLALACLALSVAGCSASTSASPSASPTATPESTETTQPERPCADDLEIVLERELGTGRSGYLLLANAGDSECSIVGFPDVVAVSANGDPLTALFHHDMNELENTPVKLAPDATAYVWIFWDDTVETMTACDQPLDAVALQFELAGMTEPKAVETAPFVVCAGGRGNGIQIGPVDAIAQPPTKGI